jgi:pre-mRNA-splicing factor 38A
MANVTDPLIRSIQGTDPQNLLEYITRQKIYDSRYWKEECFGLTVVDVLEKAATGLSCVGGTMGANQQPTKFLCLTLKLLQLQPEISTILQDFIHQEHFKYVRALGSFYLRLTGRPADIYQALEPLYGDSSKLKLREKHEWKLAFMDQVVHELLTQPYFVGITLPRLPARATLEQEGYLDEGPRPTLLETKILHAGGLEELIRHKALVEKSPAAMVLWEQRTGNHISQDDDEEGQVDFAATPVSTSSTTHKRKLVEDYPTAGSKTKKEKQQKQKKDRGYGTLFSAKSSKGDTMQGDSDVPPQSNDVEEGSDEYWNQQRAKLGLKPLNSHK